MGIIMRFVTEKFLKFLVQIEKEENNKFVNRRIRAKVEKCHFFTEIEFVLLISDLEECFFEREPGTLQYSELELRAGPHSIIIHRVKCLREGMRVCGFHLTFSFRARIPILSLTRIRVISRWRDIGERG
jgi:hypothetical protein